MQIDKKQQQMLDTFCVQFRGEITLCESLRRIKEIEWIEDLRQAKGIYDPEVATKITGSSVHPKYTRSKEIPAVAKLNNMLFPSNDRNWDIQISPKPKVSDEAMNLIIQSLVQLDEQGQPQMPTQEMVQKGIAEFAIKACDGMRETIDDQLTALKFSIAQKKMIKSAVRFGTGILKGPLSKSFKLIETIQRPGGTFEQVENITYSPDVAFLPIWYWYPDMSTSELEQMDYSYELHPMTKQELRRLARREDFMGEVITKFVADNPSGNYKFRNWEVELYTIKDEAVPTTAVKKYEVWERWGYVEGEMLKSAYEATVAELPEGFNENEDYWANIWILGDKVIKAIINPLPDDPKSKEVTKIYHVFYYEKDESSLWGSGLPRSIKDTDETICAATRAMLDNAARVSGPIVEINVDLLAPDETPENLHPNRIFQREGRSNEANFPAIRAINIDSHIREYIEIISLFKSMGDEESSMPAFVNGESGGNETARGMSIRSSNTNVTIGDIIKNFDDCNESFLRAMYAWNMEFNPDETIKGDFEVKAKGSTSLMTKELRIQALDYFSTTLTPSDEPYIQRGNLLRIRSRAHDLHPEDFINTDEVAQQIIQSQQDPQAAELQKADLAAKVDYKKAQTEHVMAKTDATDKGTVLKAADMGHKMQAEDKAHQLKAVDMAYRIGQNNNDNGGQN